MITMIVVYSENRQQRSLDNIYYISHYPISFHMCCQIPMNWKVWITFTLSQIKVELWFHEIMSPDGWEELEFQIKIEYAYVWLLFLDSVLLLLLTLYALSPPVWRSGWSCARRITATWPWPSRLWSTATGGARLGISFFHSWHRGDHRLRLGFFCSSFLGVTYNNGIEANHSTGRSCRSRSCSSCLHQLGPRSFKTTHRCCSSMATKWSCPTEEKILKIYCVCYACI